MRSLFPSAWLARGLVLTGLAALGGALLAGAPASAAGYRCAAAVSINDAGPGTDFSQSTPCGAQFGSPNSAGYAATTATAGLLRAGNHAASSGDPSIVGTSAYGEAFDQVRVAGLGETGAVLTFNVFVEGLLRANMSGPRTLGGPPTASSSFSSRVTLSTDGRGDSNQVNGCANVAGGGVSTCNGLFTFGVAPSVDAFAAMPVSIFLRDGDILNIVLSLQTSAFTRTVDRSQAAEATADFGHTMYWGGLVFTDATRNVELTSLTSGFDYRYSALPPVAGVPEPASWAVMILGFGLAGSVLRRRTVLAA